MHIMFDNPGRQPASPMAFEHKHRDDSNVLSHDHKLYNSQQQLLCPHVGEIIVCLVGNVSVTLFCILVKHFWTIAQSLLRSH